MNTTATKRTIAHEARLFAQDHDLAGGFGTRGRVSANVVFQYLQGQSAKEIRDMASDLGIEVAKTGKISEAELVALTDYVAKNTPKS